MFYNTLRIINYESKKHFDSDPFILIYLINIKFIRRSPTFHGFLSVNDHQTTLDGLLIGQKVSIILFEQTP